MIINFYIFARLPLKVQNFLAEKTFSSEYLKNRFGIAAEKSLSEKEKTKAPVGLNVQKSKLFPYQI